MKKALIVVDIQNDFCEKGPLAVPEAESIIPVVNDLMKNGNYDLIVATQDWHPKNHNSFASNNNKKIGEFIDLNGTNQIMWPDHCIQHSTGALFHKDLDSHLFHEVVKKGKNPEIDSYSGFWDNERKNQTELFHILKAYQIQEIHVVGLALDYCVKATALDSVELGFDTTLIYNATKAVNLNKDDYKKAIKELLLKNVKVV